jgi:formamidopyrimidine-DNA glycosylase
VPEGVEVELYRRALAAVARPGTDRSKITRVKVIDPTIDPSGELRSLDGSHIETVTRHGKVLLIGVGGPLGGRCIAVRFGMTGRLVAGVLDPVGALAYGPRRADDGRWDRLHLELDGHCVVRISDPRRLGSVTVDPDLSAIGPDVWQIDAATFARCLGTGRAAVKSALMDQRRLAGLGNMSADELLWRAGVDPRRPVGALRQDELDRMHLALGPMLEELLENGGSHAGQLSVGLRVAGACCPVDGAALVRRSIGGRSTWWCPAHQR